MKATWTFTADCKGYMLYRDGVPQGGAGVLERPRHWRHQRANRVMFAEQARRECQQRNSQENP